MTNIIKMYTRSGCGNCTQVKKFLNARKIEFEEINADGELEYLNSLNARTLPVIVFDDKVIEGFDIKELRKLVD